MNKSIELTQSQIKAYEDGATVFMFPINKDMQYGADNIEEKVFIKRYSPIQRGDKNIFIKEDTQYCIHCGNTVFDIQDTGTVNGDIIVCSNCNEEHYYKDGVIFLFKECIDVRVVRVKDTENTETFDEYSKFMYKLLGYKRGMYSQCLVEDIYNNQMQEQNIDRTYEDNDYVFLVEFRR